MGRAKNHKQIVPHKSKLKKDPGIPRLPDLKTKVRNAQKDHMPPPVRRLDQDTQMASEPTLSTLAALAAETSASQDDGGEPSSSLAKTKEQIRKHYLRTLHRVIDQSDIIILVLDARDPEGCRSRLVEEEVRRRESEGKKLIFVLNKIDLVPRANAQLWLKHLRHSTPTLPFLSSASSHQRSNISSSTAPSLIKLLKAYKPKIGTVTIGVVGYPNVGKSSLINSLKRSKVCPVAAQPGHTKDLQSVQLERGIRIVDSPGVVFDDDDESSKGSKKGSVLLRNVVKVEDVEDPIAVVEEILARTDMETIRKIYNLPEYSSPLEFLTMLALNSGRLLKGGTPDLNSAARQVLTDWNHQKIPYYSTPPAVHPSQIPSLVSINSGSNANVNTIIAPGAEDVGKAQILDTFSKPFELEGLFGTADAGAFGPPHDDVKMGDEDGDIFWDAVESMEEDGMQIESEELTSPNSRKRPRSPSLLESEVQAEYVGGSEIDNQPRFVRQPKRQRKSKEVPEYDARPDANVLDRMEVSNPLSRKSLKKIAKRVKKLHKVRVQTGDRTGGMEVDDGGEEFTFMV